MRLALLMSATLFLAVMCACGGGGSPSGAEEDVPLQALQPSPTATATPVPDTDTDGISDAVDACPNKPETPAGPDVDSPDGCPDTLEDYVAFAVKDIGGYWQLRTRSFGIVYAPPVDVVCYTEPIRTACGRAVLGNAFYCALDHKVYYDAAFLAAELAQHGDFAPVFILAHEWGHVLQANLGLVFNQAFFSIDLELQADCMAGVYTASADERKLLDLGDLDEAAVTLLAVGDQSEVAWYDEGAHGTAEERVAAFRAGYAEGLGVCGRVSRTDTRPR